ncbi:hypothetical protein LJC27_02845 [Christensenellaceae bacterium OttesenSCG-928-M15]|nr:hypothetical protein [Christensenellaceae bacterium OttesenSCG-928-M15]
MQQNKKQLKFLQTPGIQKLLLICACLLLCALIYLFISVNAKEDGATTASSPYLYVTPSPLPTATPVPGVRRAVVLSRLKEAGVSLQEQEESSGLYVLEEESPLPLSIIFSNSNGYICGFTVTLSGIEKPDTPKNPSFIDQQAKLVYEDALAAQDKLIQSLLPALLDAINPTGYFPAATGTAWAALSTLARDTGELQREEAHGYLFSATGHRDGSLTLAVGFQ